MTISPDVHILTTADLQQIKQVEFARGVERGKFEASARLIVLEAALRPFAYIADAYDRAEANTNARRRDEGAPPLSPRPDSHRISASLGELRRARSALSVPDQEKPDGD